MTSQHTTPEPSGPQRYGRFEAVAPRAPARPTQTRAWIALVLACLPVLNLAGLALGLATMRDSRPHFDQGRRKARAAVVIGSGWLVAGAVVLAVGVVHLVTSPAVPPTDARAVAVGELHVGDCLRDALGVGAKVRVTTVPCDEPHHGEVFAQFELRGDAYHEHAASSGVAERGCLKRRPAAITTSGTHMTWLMPRGSAYFASDKTVTCMLEAASALDHRFDQSTS